MTISAGMIAWFFVADFPQKARFLSTDARVRAVERLNQDRGDGNPDKISAAKVLAHLSDWKVWGLGLLVFTISCNIKVSSLQQQLHVMLLLISFPLFSTIWVSQWHFP